MQLQSMPDASPSKWHLAHTTWFFETLLLKVYLPEYQAFNPHYQYLYNSYYNGIGKQYPRAQRGLISRPSLSEILSYRAHVDAYMRRLLIETESLETDCTTMIELGIQHEQQHQELLLMDIKHAFFQHPAYPAYRALPKTVNVMDDGKEARLPITVAEGLYEIGASNTGFAFDNEKPCHQVYLYDVTISSRLVTNGDYVQFIQDGGYQSPLLWLSDGWAWKTNNNVEHPYYWMQQDDQWCEFTLYGLQPLTHKSPVVHLSYYEACAYATWAQCRLPTEAEWEIAQSLTVGSSCEAAETLSLHPTPTNSAAFMHNVWQWTSSSYGAYPGYQPFAGAAGEYNGKFMNDQKVLRGSACITPPGHARATYRNFYYAHQFWPFTGIRLAKDRL